MRWSRIAAHWRILAALVAAMALSPLLGAADGPFADGVSMLCRLGGGLFINALKMLVMPLVASSLVAAVMGLGSGGDFGRLFGRLCFWVLTTSLAAALLGLALVDLIGPGRGGAAAAAGAARQSAPAGLFDVLLGIVPANPLAAAAGDHLLGVVFFSIVFGVFAARLPEAQAEAISGLARAVFAAMIGMARWVLGFAPLGVFLLALDAFSVHGLGTLRQLAWYMLTVFAGLAAHALVVLPLLLVFVARRSPLRLWRAVAPAVLTAFSTASSKAALPITMEAMEGRALLSPRIVRFVLPLSATVNMNGSALYECVAALFVAQLYGVPLGLSGQLLVVLVALLTTLGLSGMPGAGVIGLTTVLAAAGLPADGLALLLGVDRLLDMARTGVNVWGDACLALLVARNEPQQAQEDVKPTVS